jgi:ketosteroid isomerase-like protein
VSARHRRRAARRRGGEHLEFDYGWLVRWTAGRISYVGLADKDSCLYAFACDRLTHAS